MKTLLELLRCNTLEACQRIQRGYLPLRRLGKWSVLFTIALMLLVNDGIAICVDGITLTYEQLRVDYNTATDSVVYRWTLGWFYPHKEVPQLDERTLTLYRTVNTLQFLFF